MPERLRFWRKKQATVILTRQEDQPFDFDGLNVPTAENLVVKVRSRLTIQMQDVAMFLQNMLGPREAFSMGELDKALRPLLQQALWEAVGRISITDLTGPQVRSNIDTAVEQALTLSMQRYGLRFGQVHMVSVSHEEYDEHRRKLGETWLWRERIEQEKTRDELASEDQLRQIKQKEKSNDLAVLAAQVETDRMEGKLAVLVRRVGVLGQWRDALQSHEFDNLKRAEERARMLQEGQKSGMLRESEIKELEDLLAAKAEDRESARKLLLCKLEFERNAEVLQVRMELAHAVRLKATDEDEWQDLLHRQRVGQVQGEIEFAQVERRRRVEQVAAEIHLAREQEEADLGRRKAQAEQDIAGMTFRNQIEKMTALQRMNAEYVQRQFDMRQNQQRLDVELAELRADKASQRDRERLQVLKDFGPDALIATTDLERGKLLLEKHRISEQTKQVAGESHTAQSLAAERAAHLEAAQAEQLRQFQKMFEAQQADKERLAQAYREGMSGQQFVAQQGFAAMGQMGHANVIVPPAGVVPPGQYGPGAGPQGPAAPAGGGQSSPPPAVICTKCRAENPKTNRCCGNCGAPL